MTNALAIGTQTIKAHFAETVAGIQEAAAARGQITPNPASIQDAYLDAKLLDALAKAMLSIVEDQLPSLITLINGREQRAHEIELENLKYTNTVALENLKKANEKYLIDEREAADLAILAAKEALNAPRIAWQQTQYSDYWTWLQARVATIMGATVPQPDDPTGEQYGEYASAYVSQGNSQANAMTTIVQAPNLHTYG